MDLLLGVITKVESPWSTSIQYILRVCADAEIEKNTTAINIRIEKSNPLRHFTWELPDFIPTSFVEKRLCVEN
jgi:hypothetical protein